MIPISTLFANYGSTIKSLLFVGKYDIIIIKFHSKLYIVLGNIYEITFPLISKQSNKYNNC